MAKSKVSHTELVQVDAAPRKLPVESLRVGLVCLSEHHNGPDAPVIVVKNHALLYLKHLLLKLGVLWRKSPGICTLF